MKWELIFWLAFALIDANVLSSEVLNRIVQFQRDSSVFSANSSFTMRSALRNVACKANGIYAHPETASKYIVCAKFPTMRRLFYYEFNCPSQSTFDTTEKKCVIREDADPCAYYKKRREFRGGDNEETLPRAEDDDSDLIICS